MSFRREVPGTGGWAPGFPFRRGAGRTMSSELSEVLRLVVAAAVGVAVVALAILFGLGWVERWLLPDD